MRPRGLFTDQSGSSAIEYAAMLALIVAVALVAIDGLGLMGRRSFGHVSQALAPNDPSARSRPANQTQTISADEMDDLIHPLKPWGHLLLASALVLAIGANLRLLRRLNRANRAVAESQVADDKRVQARFLEKRQQILRALGSDISKVLSSRVEVRHVMTDRVRTVRPTTPVKTVTELMNELQTRHLLVCSEDGKLLGVISDRDLSTRPGQAAQEIMTPRPVTIPPETALSPAITTMLDRHISCLPVVQDGQLCGVLTSTDLIMTLQCCLQALSQMLGWLVPEHGDDEVRGALAVGRAVTITELCRAGER